MHLRKSLLLLFLIQTLNTSFSQDIKFVNEGEYLGEIFTHTSINRGDKIHLLGWLLNNSTLEIGKHHSLNLGVMLTHGGEPSVNIIGDLQTFSNLEAGFLYGFYETYYQFTNNDFWLKIGQQDINTDFLVTENGTLFTHSSFGIDAVATVNMPAPTYPVTGLSLTSEIKISDISKIRLGIFDGQFALPKKNYLRIDWTLKEQDGLLYIFEAEQHFFDNKLVQKLGFYHHSGEFLNYNTQLNTRGLKAFYSVTDLQISENLHSFLQLDFSQKNLSMIKHYIGGGFRYEIDRNASIDELGLAIAHVAVNPDAMTQSNGIKHETTLEVNYKRFLSTKLQIQPYIHFIGMKEFGDQESNPFVFALRAHYQF